jgi:homoserine O-acetyltransferase/O-succinyltransferase
MLFCPVRFAIVALFANAAATYSQTMSMPEARPSAGAQTVPAHEWPAVDGTVTLPDFRFGTGETLPQLRLHYLTLGTPHRDAGGRVDNAVLLLHGTGGNAHTLLNPVFSDVLFGPGAPLDIAKYFLILPDDIGHGQSSKPSDGLRMRFPHYDYDDMVRSQKMMLEEMNIDHLRLILGTSMGCMQTFVWGEAYPGFADALMPLACLPVQIAGRNRMMRYLAIEDVKEDPAWMNGEYKTEPVEGLRAASELSFIMGSSPLQLQKQAPTRAQAEEYIDQALAWTTAHTDANDLIYYLDASRSYDPSAHLDRITVPVMWINSGDDFINPPELGIADKMVKQMPRARFVLIPISDATRGHGTHTVASLWENELIELMRESGR